MIIKKSNSVYVKFKSRSSFTVTNSNPKITFKVQWLYVWFAVRYKENFGSIWMLKKFISWSINLSFTEKWSISLNW